MRIVKVSDHQDEDLTKEDAAPLRRYVVSWQETYEMQAIVYAPCLEKAMGKAYTCRTESPLLIDAGRWSESEDDEEGLGSASADVLVDDDLLEVSAFFETASTLECLPSEED